MTARTRRASVATALVLAGVALLLLFLRNDAPGEPPAVPPQASIATPVQPASAPQSRELPEAAAPALAKSTLKVILPEQRETPAKGAFAAPAALRTSVANQSQTSPPKQPAKPDSVFDWGPWSGGQPAKEDSASAPKEGTPHGQGFTPVVGAATQSPGGGSGGNPGGGTGGTPPPTTTPPPVVIPPPPIAGMPPGNSGNTPGNSGLIPNGNSWNTPAAHPSPPGGGRR